MKCIISLVLNFIYLLNYIYEMNNNIGISISFFTYLKNDIELY